MDLKSRRRRLEIPLTHPERHVNEADECGDFNPRPDDSHERLARVQAEDRNCYCDRPLAVIPGKQRADDPVLDERKTENASIAKTSPNFSYRTFARGGYIMMISPIAMGCWSCRTGSCSRKQIKGRVIGQ
jgi:hypothetical protein